jgi:hypothetical protein
MRPLWKPQTAEHRPILPLMAIFEIGNVALIVARMEINLCSRAIALYDWFVHLQHVTVNSI